MTERADLPTMDRRARLTRVRAAIVAEGCDAVVVTKPVNVRWLSGFTGSNATAILTEDRLTIITDGRYATQIEQQLAEADVSATVEIEREIREPLLRAVGDHRSIGLEGEHVTWAQQRRFAEWLGDRTLVPTGQLIETERQVKDPGEIARLRLAASIADQALAVVAPLLPDGRTERDLARTLDATMLDLGADDLSFATIVAAGENSAKPHATPSDRPVQPGDIVVMDFGAAVDGYGSDMTRSFLVGPTTARQSEVFEAVRQAQAAGVQAVKAGVEEREIDRVCRQKLEDHGLAEAFVHGTGHGIGLEIHENPILSTRATGILRSGYVVTVEPGVYLPDLGGVRIEDSVVVTESGCEPITLSSKSPIVEAR